MSHFCSYFLFISTKNLVSYELTINLNNAISYPRDKCVNKAYTYWQLSLKAAKRCSIQKAVYKNFAIFTGKHLC